MAETEPTTPSAEPHAEVAGATGPTGTEAVAGAAAAVAAHVVPSDEKHVDPQELFGGDVVEPEHADGKPGEPFEPLGAINSRP
ncbi:hypothetical protein ACIRS1_28280 [Kitasatospora sp. NPDC101176]|uniref:hypothetical protein n=1 Tax=Kitasatospora sp. NPDC101176 TaxID=3364099 RepID=UPI003823DFE2